MDDGSCGRMATVAYGRLRARGATEGKIVPEKPDGRGADSVWGRVTVAADSAETGGVTARGCNAGKTSDGTEGCGCNRNCEKRTIRM